MAPHPASAPRVKILLAGVDKDTRALVEGEVKRALASRDAAESWTVSLVKVAGKWSVTLDGPEQFRNLSFTADGHRLADVIRGAIGAPAGMAAPLSPASAMSPKRAAAWQAGEARTPASCERCGKSFVVVYESPAGDTKTLAAVACPHCWEINRVEVGAWAAAGRDYRAERA